MHSKCMTDTHPQTFPYFLAHSISKLHKPWNTFAYRQRIREKLRVNYSLHNELLTLVYERSVPKKGQGLGPGIPSFLKNPCGQTP